MDEAPIKKLRLWFDQLKADRRSYESFYRDVKDYICPSRGRFLAGESSSEVNDGRRKDLKIINGIAEKALEVLASGMQSGVSPKSRQWFKIGSTAPGGQWDSLRKEKYYKLVQDRLYAAFDRTNIYNGLYHCYCELAAFGTCAMGIYEHRPLPGSSARFMFCRPFTAGSYWLSSNAQLEVDSFFSLNYMTSKQIVDEFGKRGNIPRVVRETFERGDYETRFRVINAILRHPELLGIRPGSQGIASCYFLDGDGGNENNGMIEVRGYDTFPILVARWDVIDVDVYGWSPSRKVIGDAKQLQAMEEDKVQVIRKQSNPPMKVPMELLRRGVNVQPGGLNPVSAGSTDALTPLYQVAPQVDGLVNAIAACERSITDGFYNQIFSMFMNQDTNTMTAREVEERHEEKLLMLGPVLEHIHYELLDPLIDRAYNILVKLGEIPPPPFEQDGGVRIEYVSTLSQAQKSVEVRSTEAITAFAGQLSAVFPEIRNAYDPYEAVSSYAKSLGVSPGIIRDQEEYAKRVSDEAQQQQMAQQAQVGQQLAQGAKTMSEVDPDNLSLIVNTMTGGGVQ